MKQADSLIITHISGSVSPLLEAFIRDCEHEHHFLEHEHDSSLSTSTTGVRKDEASERWRGGME
jgi:hypothetical protein